MLMLFIVTFIFVEKNLTEMRLFVCIFVRN